MRLARLLLPLLVALAGAAQLRAQSVHWDPPSGTIPAGQTTALRLVFENCKPKDQPTIPRVADLTMQFLGPTTQSVDINGQRSFATILTFAIALTKNHPVDIPAFNVETDDGKTMRVAAAHFESAAATVGRTNTPLEAASSAKLTVTPSTVWAGEVFDLATTVEASRSYYPQFHRGFDWTPDPLIAESWSDPQGVEFVVNGEPHNGFQYRTRALARNPGRFNLNAATHMVDLSVGVSGFGFFQQRQYDQYSITSNTPTLEIKALPAPPPGYNGAVGQFKLTSKIVPEKAGVGEPITWTLELSGTGNWPDIAGLPSRDVSNDFHVVQPKAKRTPAEGRIFEVSLSEDVVLVPKKAGSYALGPVNFIYFDPKSGSYKTLTAPRTMITISAPPKPLFNLDNNANAPAETAKSETSATAAPATPIGPVAAATPPAGIPRDPLPGSGDAAVPITLEQVASWMITPYVVLVLAWIVLAFRQAKRTDPLRLRREARARLGATLARLRSASAAERPALLLAWQHDAAILWQIAHAAPPATALTDATWATLWIESDRALYGTHGELPADWQARAEAALAAKRLPGFQPLRLFLPRNLFPFAALLAFAFLWSAGKAEDPTVLYRRGEFAGAEKIWRERVSQHPTDWIARHNLSLALEQLERVGEAQAQAAAAFVQHPSDEAVRWHFRRLSQKAGVAPGALAAFVAPTINQSLAEHRSPTQWQWLLIGAAWLAALALGAILFNAYRWRSLAVLLTAWGIVVLSFCGGVVSLAGLTTYQEAADARAVVVIRAGTLRSIPTEADTQQKTTPLATGTLAVADKTFLGWTHLAFENGQTGWVRKEELVSLWR